MFTFTVNYTLALYLLSYNSWIMQIHLKIQFPTVSFPNRYFGSADSVYSSSNDSQIEFKPALFSEEPASCHVWELPTDLTVSFRWWQSCHNSGLIPCSVSLRRLYLKKTIKLLICLLVSKLPVLGSFSVSISWTVCLNDAGFFKSAQFVLFHHHYCLIQVWRKSTMRIQGV